MAGTAAGLSVLPADSSCITSKSFFSSLAVRAMSCEISLTPKPGLVDRVSNGAHSDMYPLLFYRSIGAVAPWFTAMEEAVTAEISRQADRGQPCSPRNILPLIRPLGIRAEEDMFASTGGINTHKGQIFTLGVCLSAAVYHSVTDGGALLSPGEVLDTAGVICRGISKELSSASGDSASAVSSHGQKNYKAYGSGGIRAEAEAGYPSVRRALPCFLDVYRQTGSRNLAGIQTLLTLMSFVDDGNVLHRGGREGLVLLQNEAADFLQKGGVFQNRFEDVLTGMDTLFIRHNLSPGGSADLLALVYFLAIYEGIRI